MEDPAEQSGLSLQWDKTAGAAREASDFAGRVIGSDARYISHGEIQTGLSPDGEHWASDLTQFYRDDFAELGDDRDLLICRNESGTIIGIAVVAWEESSRRRFAVLEDMAVEPSRRSQGVGERLIDAVQARVAAQGIDWLFLESGLENHRAHAFFEREGFKTVSHVFAKRL
jgi:GNAT superfamily N-acetyltransferase